MAISELEALQRIQRPSGEQKDRISYLIQLNRPVSKKVEGEPRTDVLRRQKEQYKSTMERIKEKFTCQKK